MTVITGYLSAAEQAVTLMARPDVVAAWQQPSALPEMTTGALAGHLAFQILSVSAALSDMTGSDSTEPPIPLLEHYERAAWVGAPLDGEANAGIRARAEQYGTDGPLALVARARAALAEQRGELAKRTGAEPVMLSSTGWALRLDDFLVTRLVELVVHQDDLAVGLGWPTPEFTDEAYDPVLLLLARLAARRHGQGALLRALTRAERAPGAVNVF
ncbi:maleylpyruvate isomerase N-terminal domain-containing protein [Kitasatospora sp. RB6PN24]|uniref:maleylpyruvate isomerase N-terminal domain-containing protein n=1 Tax=Kitasatospora humi TaxID=2893891 RepID=UPI001E609A8E|nr:maleylpyruvate isomerase N-terminal domain-containing protein [Kitasatospora humi]MCC9307176.1 maleylpyruvate isomerase N-terminal domain-containing protein [Kitasatospora humi]